MKTNVITGLAILNSFLLTNSLPAKTWVQTSAPTNVWSSIACSADGTKLFACAGGGAPLTGDPSPIYASTNGGLTWKQTSAPSNYWASIASSADGSKLIAVAGTSSMTGSLYTSADGGLTWRSNNIPPQHWTSVASSANGSNLFAIAQSQLFVTTNAGAVWSSQATPLNGVASSTIAVSADGLRLAGFGRQFIYISTNFGTTWITNSSPSIYDMWSVASSANGRVLAVVDGHGSPFGHVFTSTNFGTTWVTNDVPPLSWQDIAVSADGQKMIAGAWYSSGIPSGPIYTSTNSGQTWVSNSIPNSVWNDVICSADGNMLVAVSAGTNSASFGKGRIWISKTTPPPSLNITPANNSFMLSWLVPSTNFVVQQSSDLSNWAGLTNMPQLNITNLEDEVTLPLSGGSSFYRLKTP